MKNETKRNETKQKYKYGIVLVRNREELPQTGLGFNTKESAQYVADYLNEILPKNLRDSEYYEVRKLPE
ncbi:MAG: hypothetical protein K5765_07025 [Clostridia bacterium]|nr:hypothetical protein [Clostridia bacterium]